MEAELVAEPAFPDGVNGTGGPAYLEQLMSASRLGLDTAWIWMEESLRAAATHPSVDRVLKEAAASPSVKAFGMMVLGREEWLPLELLMVILALLVIVYSILISFIAKARFALWALFYFFLSADKKTTKPTDAPFDFKAPGCKRVKIVFIRHGESEWNYIFNKGPVLVRPFRLAVALVKEALMFFRQDSLFIDSPLSSTGIQQAWDLLTFLASQPLGCLEEGDHLRPIEQLEDADIVSIMRNDAGSSVMASSILRRAISTGLISLSPRLLKTSHDDKMVLMTSLQEMGRNIDTLTLTPKGELPVVPAVEAGLKNMGDLMSDFYGSRLDIVNHTGNKSLKQKTIKRQEEFVRWAFKQKADCLIVCGHSGWFRDFFKSYLPKASVHICKKSKIVNCGVVAFDFYRSELRGGREPVLRICEKSIREVYGGFELKGKSKKA